MKRFERYYPACLAVLNILLAQGTRFIAQAMRVTYDGVYEPGRKAFAPLTLWALHLHWWPYVAAGVCLLALAFALAGKLSEACILHAMLALLVVEGFILFMTSLAFVMPFISFP